MIDFAAMRRNNSLAQIAGRHTSLRQWGHEWVGLCPFHSERTPSFTIYDDDRRFHCFGCGATGDVIDFLRLTERVETGKVAHRLAGHAPAASKESSPAAPRADRMAEARKIWERSAPAAGTPAEAYLRWRGINTPCPPCIRFLPLPYGHGAPIPCLIAAVRDVSGEVIGIQRVWLARDGKGKADLPKPKLSLGAVKGGAIRLAEPSATDVLVVCEGPEDGLSVMQMLSLPVWVAAGASLLPGMQFPPAVRSIVIGTDNDPAGLEAAARARAAFNARGLSVRVIQPLPGFKDFNDELRGAN